MNNMLSLLGSFLLLSNLSVAAISDKVSDSSGFILSSQYSDVAIEKDKSAYLHVLIDLKAPLVVKNIKKRAPLNIALVIDRSGSMDEAKKLDYAIKAGKELVKALDVNDRIALVQYDSKVDVLSPLQKANNKDALIKKIEGIRANGMTFLSGGLEEGIRQLNSTKNEGMNRVILLSDGLANEGITDAAGVSRIGSNAKERGIAVTTVGLGRDYDERLMQLLAQRGGGQYYYVRDSEDLPAFFRQELGSVANSFTKNIRVNFKPNRSVTDYKVYGYVTSGAKENVAVATNDLSSEEVRQILVSVRINPEKATKIQNIGTVDVSFELAADNKQSRKISLPLAVTVTNSQDVQKLNAQAESSRKLVKDQALLLNAEETHVAAIDALEKGDTTRAKDLMAQSAGFLADASPDNVLAINKMAGIQRDQEKIETARPEEIKAMSKDSKNSYYNSSQGKQQQLLLQKGDKGALVEKLQRTLAAKKLYVGTTDGVYSAELVNAVKAFQKTQSLPETGVADRITMDALGM